MPKTAILGQGRMGSAMAVRLRQSGTEVTVWNRDPARCEPARATGAAVAGTPAEAVAAARLVLVMLADGPAVAEVLAEAVPALAPDAVVVQLSTIAPEQTRELAARYPRAAFLDAPVKGSVPQVCAGSLAILAGGEPAVVDTARPVLEQLGTIVDCGGIGDGSAAKLVVNAAMIAATTALAESLALAADLGIDEKSARELLSTTPLGPVLERHVPSGGDFPLYLAAKDVRLARRSVTTGLPVLAGVQRHLAEAAEPDSRSGLWTAVTRAVDGFGRD